jgi:flagellar motor switch protein FliN/FliY
MAEDTPSPAQSISDSNPKASTGEATLQPGPSSSNASAAASDVSEDAASLASLDQVSIEELLKQASFEDPAPTAAQVAAPDASGFKLPNFQQVMQDAQVSSIDLLRDVELNVKIELGRSRMLVEDVLKLSEGSVVELDKLAGDPVDVFVNERLVARGEVLVLNDNFCVRVNEIVAGVKEEGL